VKRAATILLVLASLATGSHAISAHATSADATVTPVPASASPMASSPSAPFRVDADRTQWRYEHEGLTVLVTLEPARPRTTDQFSLAFTTILAPGLAMVEPEIEREPDPGDAIHEPTLGGMTVLDRRDSPVRANRAGQLVRTRRLTLEQMLPGAFDIPPITFRAIDAQGGQVASVTTGRIVVEVFPASPQGLESALLEEDRLDVGALRGVLDPPLRQGVRWVEPLLWVLGLLTLVIAALFGLLIWFSRTSESRRFERELQSLRRLRSEIEETPEPARASLDEAWSEARHAIDRCIADKLDPLAGSRSDTELTSEAGDWFGLTERDRIRFATLLADLERGRFAGGEPADRAQTVRMLDETLEIIERLRAASEMVVADAPGQAENPS